MTFAIETFRNHEIRLLQGKTHPAYSLSCFDEERAFREEHFQPEAGQVVVDVGASYGAYALSALAMGARVMAFEPELTVMVDLARNIGENDWWDRCSLFGCGLYSAARELDMRSYAPHWPAQTITGAYQMIALDSLGLRRCDWLKIDVEGAEVHALIGAMETIRRCKPRVIVECHTFLDASIPERVRAVLKEYELTEVPREPCVMLVGRAK